MRRLGNINGGGTSVWRTGSDFTMGSADVYYVITGMLYYGNEGGRIAQKYAVILLMRIVTVMTVRNIYIQLNSSIPLFSLE